MANPFRRRPRRPTEARQHNYVVWGFIGVAVFVLFFYFVLGLHRIRVGEVGVVVYPGGIREEVLTTGWNWLPIPRPFAYVEKVPTRVQSAIFLKTPDICARDRECDDIAISAPTTEGKSVMMDMTVQYQLKDPNMASELLINFGPDWKTAEKRVVLPIIRGSVYETTGDYSIIPLYAEDRDEVADAIEKRITEELDYVGFDTMFVVIRDIEIPQEIQSHIDKVIDRQQQVEQKKFELETERLEKERKIVEAEGTKQATILRAEGDKESKILQAQGEAQGIKLVRQETEKLSGNALNYAMMDQLKHALGSNSKIVFADNNQDLLSTFLVERTS